MKFGRNGARGRIPEQIPDYLDSEFNRIVNQKVQSKRKKSFLNYGIGYAFGIMVSMAISIVLFGPKPAKAIGLFPQGTVIAVC